MNKLGWAENNGKPVEGEKYRTRLLTLQLMSCNVNSVEIMMADLGRKMKLGRSYRN